MKTPYFTIYVGKFLNRTFPFLTPVYIKNFKVVNFVLLSLTGIPLTLYIKSFIPLPRILETTVLALWLYLFTFGPFGFIFGFNRKFPKEYFMEKIGRPPVKNTRNEKAKKFVKEVLESLRPYLMLVVGISIIYVGTLLQNEWIQIAVILTGVGILYGSVVEIEKKLKELDKLFSPSKK